MDVNQKLQEKLESMSSKELIKQLLQDNNQYDLSPKTLGLAFEKMYADDKGFSPVVYIDDLFEIHHSYRTQNGGNWNRENQGYLGKKYNIIKPKLNNRIYSVKLDGFNKNLIINQSIRKDISEEIKKRRCVVLDIGTNIECDHKDGMKDDWKLNDKSYQQTSDFQAMSKTVNDAKREHCKACKNSGKRYDAKKLGYSVSYTHGSENSKTCVGCYWFDPKEFNKTISKNYEKQDD